MAFSAKYFALNDCNSTSTYPVLMDYTASIDIKDPGPRKPYSLASLPSDC